MSRPHDARAVRSRDALRRALLELAETAQFDQISIRDITTAAEVSYPVFYRRYASKEDLLRDVAEEEVRRLLSLSSSAGDDGPAAAENMVPLCEYVHAHRKLWKALLTSGVAPVMRTEFMRIARDVPPSQHKRKSTIPHDLALAYVTGGIFEILAWWLGQPEDYPIDKVAKFLNALVIQPTRPHNRYLP